MNYTWLDTFLLELAGTTKDFKEEWGWTRYMVGHKLFAAICKDSTGTRDIITLKLEPSEGDFFRNQYEDIVIPGHYMNKVHWNSVYLDMHLPDDIMKEMIQKSYQLIFNGLTKKARTEITQAGR